MHRLDAEDYKGPILETDLEARASYLILDNTQEVARTKVIHLDDSGNFVLVADLSSRGGILGVEVMW